MYSRSPGGTICRHSGACRGFTLLEMSVVLAIIGVLMAGAMVMLTSSLKTSQHNATVKRMDDINAALLDFALANGRLPCPSSLTITETSSNYGVEAANPGTCTGGTPAANYTSPTTGAVDGGVPVRALKLPDSYMYDGWGRRMRYAVDPTMTASTATKRVFPAKINGPCYKTKSVIIYDGSFSGRSAEAVYAIVSHGANGHGAYTRNGVRFLNGSTSTVEKHNCHCDTDGTALPGYNGYFQATPTETTTASDAYDDITVFRNYPQMQKPGTAASPTDLCRFVHTYGGSSMRISRYDVDGTLLNGFDITPYSSNGFAMAIGKRTSTLYLVDDVLSELRAYDPRTGGHLGLYASPGTGNGQLSSPAGIAVDSLGDIWVADYVNSRVQQFSGSGTYMSKFTTDAYPWSVAVDRTRGYVYVFSWDTYTVKQYSLTGTYIGTVCGWAINNCQTPFGVALDNYGNVYVLDIGTQNVKKFASDRTYIGAPFTGGYGASPGEFTDPQAFVVDMENELWVLDVGNATVTHFANDGTLINSFLYEDTLWMYTQGITVGP